MVLHEVGILRKVHGLHGELAEALATVDGLLLGRGDTSRAWLAAMLTRQG